MKLTKEQTKKHDEACEKLKQDVLSLDDRYFVLENWNPASNHNITKGNAFFTPFDLASDFTNLCHYNHNASYIDLCAGTGILMRHMIDWVGEYNNTYVCVELNSDFIEVGKKCVPEAHWIHGDVFDKNIIQKIIEQFGYFHCCISNPPFGRNGKIKADWLNYKGTTDLMVAEIGCRISGSVNLVMPPMSVPLQYPNENMDYSNAPYTKWKEKNPGFMITPNVNIDPNYYESFQNTTIKVALAEVRSLDWEADFKPMGL